MTEKITLILADDHAMVRKGLTAFLSTAEDIQVMAVVESGMEAVSAAMQYAPDVVLLDLFMPDKPAVETIRQIKKVSPRSQIIMVTSHEGDEYVVPTTQAGAISYILKDATPEDLIRTVRKAARGESTISSRVAKALEKVVSLKMEDEQFHEDLTSREMEVLHYIAEGSSNMDIATHLNISEKTVKSHVSNILSKLYLTDRTKVAVYAWRQGLVKK
ncbi:DNA-binding response regulator, LuxR family [Sulfurospirillum halorespirans DSM 13726]|uniref:DNA-binding response regulator, LuxR family n=2 Tax=Sulfurospirillum halorespirans TaxID=194424 RepID=A0A1D7TIS3_9BACT|nr:response regulator transcription factor [Sulfurospirillum halorespirans]AOO64774.1 DNA-binding response regulator, LuxR family [Sulfurospirillum halorespirans DSM 13726]